MRQRQWTVAEQSTEPWPGLSLGVEDTDVELRDLRDLRFKEQHVDNRGARINSGI